MKTGKRAGKVAKPSWLKLLARQNEIIKGIVDWRDAIFKLLDLLFSSAFKFKTYKNL
jgi:hypothetical protein